MYLRGVDPTPNDVHFHFSVEGGPHTPIPRRDKAVSKMHLCAAFDLYQSLCKISVQFGSASLPLSATPSAWDQSEQIAQ